MNYSQMTILGFSVIFIATSLGALVSLVVGKSRAEKFSSASLGFSSGVMLAASIWSLLLPSIELSEGLKYAQIIPPVAGFISGALFMTAIADRKISKSTIKLRKPAKLFIAVTVHNIPEGLAVGFSFGSAKLIGNYAAYLTALGFAVGIAIQNVPEGAAVSLPFLSVYKSRVKAFSAGVLSGAVEPLFAVIGYFLSQSIAFIQPYLLAFSAGTMIYVVISDLLPQKTEKSVFDNWTIVVGFLIMMALDVALG